MINYLNSDNELCDLVGSPEYRRTLFFFLLSYLVRSQIWLNYFLDDRHFAYITKSLKETLVGDMVPKMRC
jgi:hypothetical protein